MSGGRDGNDIDAAREREEANIRWLLAAVLHHQPEGEPEEESD